MNAKLCKVLRKLARKETVQRPYRRHVIGRSGRVENHPLSTRGRYRHHKRVVKEVRRASHSR